MICNYICIWIYNRRGRNHTNLCSCIQKMRLKFASWEEISEKLYIWSHLEWFVFAVKLKDERRKNHSESHYTHTHTHKKNCLAWMKKVKFSIHGVCQVLITYIFHSRQNPKNGISVYCYCKMWFDNRGGSLAIYLHSSTSVVIVFFFFFCFVFISLLEFLNNSFAFFFSLNLFFFFSSFHLFARVLFISSNHTYDFKYDENEYRVQYRLLADNKKW